MNTIVETIEELNKSVEALKVRMFREKLSLEQCMDSAGLRCKKVPYGHRDELMGDYLSWDEFKPGGCWGTRDGHYLFRVKVEIPEVFSGKEVFFFLSTGADDIWNTDNPQMLVYINGIRRCGMDMNHNSVVIYEKEDWEKGRDRAVDIGIYAYSNLAENENLLNMELAARNEAVTRAYFDVLVLLEAAEALLGIRKEEELPEAFSAEVLEEKIDDRFRFSKKEILDELIAGLEEAFRILGMAGAFDEAVITEKTDILEELAEE